MRHQWTFKPGTRGGMAVPVQASIEVNSGCCEGRACPAPILGTPENRRSR